MKTRNALWRDTENRVFENEWGMYPTFQLHGNASQFAQAYALHFCKGVGFDVGCGKEEWALPGSIPIDASFDDPWDDMNLPMHEHPAEGVDYIYSSHCLEHVDHWVQTLKYWTSCLKRTGALFLYLPDYSQVYWRPWNNTKHNHVMDPEHIRGCLNNLEYNWIQISGVDLNNSFMVVALAPGDNKTLFDHVYKGVPW